MILFKMKRVVCYNTFAKDGNDMKKWFLFLASLALIFGLVACEPTTDKDVNPPIFNGLEDIQYYIGDPIPDFREGVTAIDDVDGDLTQWIEIYADALNVLVPGTYDLRYWVTDNAGNINEKIRKIHVSQAPVPDLIAPELGGTRNHVYFIGDPMPDYLAGVYAYDQIDGTLTTSIVVDDSDVHYEIAGVYELIFTVSDKSGNVTSVKVTVTVAPTPDPSAVDTLNIFYINDTHGAILYSGNQMGLSRIGNLVIDEKTLKPYNTLFIAGGDILQGTLVSNYFNGASTIHALNTIGLDAFVLGNHEFDWGLDTVTEYFNPQTTGLKANFPALGANIFLSGTTTRPNHVDAYTIVQKGDVKVGIIGVMGFGLESSIAQSRIDGYYFADPVIWVEHHARELRQNHGVHVVIAVVHGSSDYTNQGIASLSGDARVDATFNGHSHQLYARFESRSGVDMPVMQSGANGNNVGKLTLKMNAQKQVTEFQAVNMNASADLRLQSEHPLVKSVIDEYVAIIEPLLNTVIATSSAAYDRYVLTEYMAKLIRMHASADVAFHNYGGTRADITNGQQITVATLYQIFPFDNKIKTSLILGSALKNFISGTSSQNAPSYRDGLTYAGIIDSQYYKVATNDYIFDQTGYPFIYGNQVIDTGVLIRDLLEQVMKQQASQYGSFSINHPIVLSIDRIDYMHILSEELKIWISI